MRSWTLGECPRDRVLDLQPLVRRTSDFSGNQVSSCHSSAKIALACAANIGSYWTLIGNPRNIIVVGGAARRGIRIEWDRHVRVGVPVTLATLAITAVWLALRVAHAAPP